MQRIREVRKDLTGPVTYDYEADGLGTARWMDVSWNGARIRLGRYLRPGKQVRLTFTTPVAESGMASVLTRVAWCRQVSDGLDFEAGLQIFRRDAEAALTFAVLCQERSTKETSKAQADGKETSRELRSNAAYRGTLAKAI